MEIIHCVPIGALPAASRRKRKAMKLNVREAAKAAKISPSTLSRVECGGACDANTYVRMSRWILAAAPILPSI